jgi:sphingosine kinase
LQFLLGLSTGAHLSCPGVEMLAVQAFRIEPDTESSGLLTVDGEKVDYGPLQAEIFSSLATVMCP